jgi:2'-5' RNA ligase
MPADPLVLTLDLDDRLFAGLDALRQAHFPPDRNLVPAHLTLFHALPGDHLPEVNGDLADECRGRPPVPLTLPGVRSLGRGVAVAVESPELVAVRGRLARRWARWLTPQDRNGFRPHVTVQNKVTPAAAAALLADLSATWVPVSGVGRGVRVWRYAGGPWAPLARVPFAGPAGG